MGSIDPRREGFGIGLLAPLVGGGLLYGGANAGIGHAAAEIARHDGIDVLVSRARKVLKQGHSLHDLSGLAVAALWHLQIEPCDLNRVSAVGIETLNGRYGLTFQSANLGDT